MQLQSERIRWQDDAEEAKRLNQARLDAETARASKAEERIASLEKDLAELRSIQGVSSTKTNLRPYHSYLSNL